LLGGWVLNPYLAFLLFLGVGVATFRLEHHLRLTLLWLMLLVIVLLYAESGRLKASYSLLNLSRGALVGIIVALPFYLFANDFFYATASRLYGVDDWQVLLERAVFLVPILEESFFRGVVQRERGLLDGALLFGLAQGLYFVTGAYELPAVIAGVVLGMGLLGLLLGYLYKRYGLTASIACHVAVNLVLFVLPVLVEKLSEILAF
jgi:membrane protease YdiL (CAAX protease family)